MDKPELEQSSWSRAKDDTILAFRTIRFWILLVTWEAVLLVTPSLFVEINISIAEYCKIQAVVFFAGMLTLLIVVFFVIFLFTPYKQLHETRELLKSVPGYTLDSPIKAQPELHFSNIDYKFIENKRQTLMIEMNLTSTGDMSLEQVKLEIVGQKISCADWESNIINTGVTFGYTTHCEIKDELPKGEHDVRMLVYANNEWWASDWQTISY